MLIYKINYTFNNKLLYEIKLYNFSLKLLYEEPKKREENEIDFFFSYTIFT